MIDYIEYPESILEEGIPPHHLERYFALRLIEDAGINSSKVQEFCFKDEDEIDDIMDLYEWVKEKKEIIEEYPEQWDSGFSLSLPQKFWGKFTIDILIQSIGLEGHLTYIANGTTSWNFSNIEYSWIIHDEDTCQDYERGKTMVI